MPRDGHIFVVPAKANISTIVKTDLDGLMFGHGEEPVTPTRELVSLVSGLATPLREVVPRTRNCRQERTRGKILCRS